MPSHRPIDIHLRLSDAEHEQLRQLADRTDMDRSKAIRAALRAAAAMHIGGLPTCASGEPCRCPRAFPQAHYSAGGGPTVSPAGTVNSSGSGRADQTQEPS